MNVNVDKRFKVLGTNENCSIPWTIIASHEEQAIYNHGQDLETLNARGGLCWSEILAVLEDRKWSRMDEEIARKKVKNIVRTNIYTVQMIKNDDGHYIPLECCTTTNPRTSGGVSVIDDIDLPCGADCSGNCDECVIQRIMDEYAEMTRHIN